MTALDYAIAIISGAFLATVCFLAYRGNRAEKNRRLLLPKADQDRIANSDANWLQRFGF